MSFQGDGQGAELRPILPRRRQMTLLQGKPLRPDGYLFQKKILEDLAQAHLLGTSVKARRAGALQDYMALDKYLKMCKEICEKVKAKSSMIEQDDLQGAGHEITINKQWPSLEPTGHMRILHANVHGFNHTNNNMECDYFIQADGAIPS